MYSMGRAKDSSGFVLLFKLAQLGRAKDSSGFVFLLTLARTHSFASGGFKMPVDSFCLPSLLGWGGVKIPGMCCVC